MAQARQVKPCKSDKCSFWNNCPYLTKNGERDTALCKTDDYSDKDVASVD